MKNETRPVPAGKSQESRPYTLGQRIAEARKKKQMSRKVLAKLTKIPYATIAGLENGDQRKSTQTAAIAKALGVTALWLSEGKELKSSEVEESTTHAALKSHASIDLEIISRTHALLTSDNPYDLAKPEDALLFCLAYEWLAQQSEEADNPSQLFNRFLRWAAVRQATASTPSATNQRSGSVAMSNWRDSLTSFSDAEKELTKEVDRNRKLSTK
uniref:helix-turn-helix domain-containing protein n=1 Tax=Xanthomonas albilineans TaxID=29447 RepID=UPI0027DE9462|nr:helix-turn-helix transcriptional regulator [Xanthomonas albilineans]